MKQVLETYWIYIDKWYTGERAHNGDELVQVTRSAPCKSCTCHDKEEAEYVFLPFDIRVVFPTSGKELVFRDPDCREQLQGSTEQNSQTVEELHSIDKLVVLREVEKHNSFGVGSKSSV